MTWIPVDIDAVVSVIVAVSLVEQLWHVPDARDVAAEIVAVNAEDAAVVAAAFVAADATGAGPFVVDVAATPVAGSAIDAAAAFVVFAALIAAAGSHICARAAGSAVFCELVGPAFFLQQSAYAAIFVVARL